MDTAIADAHRRVVEQVMGDERLLGALPEEAAGRLLDWAVGRLDAAAARAPNAETFYAEADGVRARAREIADAVAAEGGDVDVLERRLDQAGARAGVVAAGKGHEVCPPPATPAGVKPSAGIRTPQAAPADAGSISDGRSPATGDPDVADETPRAPAEDDSLGAVPAAAQGVELGMLGDVREALDDAVDRVRALFRRWGDDV